MEPTSPGPAHIVPAGRKYAIKKGIEKVHHGLKKSTMLPISAQVLPVSKEIGLLTESEFMFI